MLNKDNYPTLNALSQVEASQMVLTEFIEWLGTKHDCFIDESRVYEFLGIDQKQLEKERRMLLAEMRRGAGHDD